MTELRVVVGVDLAVQRGKVAVFQHGQRVQLDQGQVLLVEQLVQAQHDLGQLVDLLVVEVHREAELAALVRLQPFDEVDHDGVDVFGRLAGDLLDVHAAVLGGDERDGLGITIDQDRQVQLAGDVGGVGHQHQVHRQRAAGRLVGFHVGAEHALGGSAHVVEAAAELDAAGLAAAAGVDLRLDHPLRAAKRLGGIDGSVGGIGDLARRHGDAVLREQFFGLVFVEIHSIPRANGKTMAAARVETGVGQGIGGGVTHGLVAARGPDAGRTAANGRPFSRKRAAMERARPHRDRPGGDFPASTKVARPPPGLARGVIYSTATAPESQPTCLP